LNLKGAFLDRTIPKNQFLASVLKPPLKITSFTIDGKTDPKGRFWLLAKNRFCTSVPVPHP
jgi:hypothetical protein